jgi:hypothetical protein
VLLKSVVQPASQQIKFASKIVSATAQSNSTCGAATDNRMSTPGTCDLRDIAAVHSQQQLTSTQQGVLTTSLLIHDDLGSAQDPVVYLVTRLQAAHWAARIVLSGINENLISLWQHDQNHSVAVRPAPARLLQMTSTMHKQSLQPADKL